VKAVARDWQRFWKPPRIHLSEIERETGSYPGSDHRQKHAKHVFDDIKELIPLLFFGYANRVYAGNDNDKSRYREDRYQSPSRNGLSQRNPKLAVPFGFIVGRYNRSMLRHCVSSDFSLFSSV
jgi:hypothetical protein